ncbi:MAG: iron-containing alcohol dehydrogenase [Chloroflexi bacterium]|nr:iron-containing alcohol dehydrogenase [Chloroflexota bacterium]
MPFDITSPAIIHCGAGAFSRVVDEIVRLGQRAVIVTGAHLHASQRVSNLIKDLSAHSVQAHLADPVTSEPTVEMVDELAAFVVRNSADVIVAIGGGSVMDTAKAAAAVAANGGATEDFQLRRREINQPPINLLAIPTTSGTGSEATRVSVLTNEKLGIKRSISHPLMTPGVVILDPELTVSLSKYLTTITAMDAFAHAIESAVSANANSYTRNIALAGISELDKGLPRCQADPNDLDARVSCLMGSCFAGLAMQAGMGATHSLAPAVCIVGAIRHSEAVGALLPHVIRLNEHHAPGVYEEVRRAMSCDDVAGRIEELCQSGGFANNLSQFGLKPSDWDHMLEAMNRYASHRRTNPVEVTDVYAKELFATAVGM